MLWLAKLSSIRETFQFAWCIFKSNVFFIHLWHIRCVCKIWSADTHLSKISEIIQALLLFLVIEGLVVLGNIVEFRPKTSYDP